MLWSVLSWLKTGEACIGRPCNGGFWLLTLPVNSVFALTQVKLAIGNFTAFLKQSEYFGYLWFVKGSLPFHRHDCGGFHVSSYQAKFASHTRDHHIVFPVHSMVLKNATKCFVACYLVHTMLPNYCWVTRISAQTLGWNFGKINPMKWIENSSVFLYTMPYKKETKRHGNLCTSQI